MKRAFKAQNVNNITPTGLGLRLAIGYQVSLKWYGFSIRPGNKLKNLNCLPKENVCVIQKNLYVICQAYYNIKLHLVNK